MRAHGARADIVQRANAMYTVNVQYLELCFINFDAVKSIVFGSSSAIGESYSSYRLLKDKENSIVRVNVLLYAFK